MNNAIKTAFPASGEGSPGLSKRELFAAMAMQGILTNPKYRASEAHLIAITSRVMADALLAELAKPQAEPVSIEEMLDRR